MKLSVGIDIGGTRVKAVLLKKDGTVLSRRTVSTPNGADTAQFLEFLNSVISELISASKGAAKIDGIGIGVPGLVDHEKGKVHTLTNIAGWKDVYLTKAVNRKFKVPVYADNDVNAMCLGQLAFGSGRKYKDFVCLALGTGVGGALVVGGKLYRGANFAAGEIGHMPVVRNGKACNCGLRGCLEAYIGNKHILERAVKRLKGKGVSSVLKKKKRMELEDISEAAGLGDAFAVSVWREVAQELGLVLGAVVNLLDPEAFVIGGGVSGSGKVLFDALSEYVKEYSMSGVKRKVKIVKAGLGQYAGAIGAASLVWEKG